MTCLDQLVSEEAHGIDFRHYPAVCGTEAEGFDVTCNCGWAMRSVPDFSDARSHAAHHVEDETWDTELQLGGI